MNYSVTCQCGKTHPVTATQAGSTLLCDCSRQINVPLLSALRRAAGETPIPLSTVETIEAMIARGKLPNNKVCPHSGRAADATIYLQVACEQTWDSRANKDFITAIIGALTFFWLESLMAVLGSKPGVIHGRETFVNVPVRVAAAWADEISRIKKQAVLKDFLRKTPIYSKLLDEFPEASVTVKTWR